MEKQRRRANLFQETYDIVGSLPIELVLEITEYLRPADIARNLKVRITGSFTLVCHSNLLIGGILGLETMATDILVQGCSPQNTGVPEHGECRSICLRGDNLYRMALSSAKRPTCEEDVSPLVRISKKA